MDSDEKEKKKNKQIITEKMEINRLNSTKTNLPGLVSERESLKYQLAVTGNYEERAIRNKIRWANQEGYELAKPRKYKKKNKNGTIRASI
ncbi:hypothetical protein OsI_08752 [Oryza sativa Indica Group]|uniref:Uncharacterized protein n=1 Tax=Oryza sativa subsp. indica TaxID=39946 RepID=B8AHP3_ORYSI|nr:hypothetical protein OsI_08752 [Oryza sativa Indica Group]